MITEKEAIEALPPQGFVRYYVAYAMKQTTSPAAYHVGVAHSLLGATVPTTYGCRFATDQRPNIYVMLAGRSGDDQKSTAIEIGRELLFEAAPELIGDHPGSAEGMVDSLSRQGTQLLVYKEMGRLLASTQRGYLEPLKALLTDLADASSIQRAKSSKKGQQDVIRVNNPRLSIVGACSLPFLEKHTEAVDWTGGFLGRWALIFAQRERVNTWPSGDTAGRDLLINALKARANATAAGWCMGPSPAARKIWDEWFYSIDSRPLPPLVAGARTRAPVFALKAALLYGWDYGPAPAGEPWYIEPDVLIPAIAFAEMYVKSIVNLSSRLADGPEARQRRKVLACFNPGEYLKIGDVLKRSGYKRRTAMEIIDTLEATGAIESIALANGISVYALTAPA